MRHERFEIDGRAAAGVSLIRPVILSGGAGTRLWPLSRPDRPKQVLPIAGRLTMIQATAVRTLGSDFADPILVASQGLGSLVRDQLRAVGVEPAATILEPEGRNTAAAIALAALWAQADGGDDLLLVMPSDHVIDDVPAFHAAIEAALPAAHAGALVTFGIRPTAPETGYGYIGPGRARRDAPGVFAVDAFFEKPDRARAESFCANRYLWNGGIFLFRASALLRELAEHAPETAAACRAAVAAGVVSDGFFRPEPEAFARAPNVAIDVAVMERTRHAAVVPVGMGWSDVGSWQALWEIAARDGNGNAVRGDVLALDSRDCLLRAEGEMTVAVIGVSGLAVIATPGAVLVVPRERAQETSDAVKALKAAGSRAVAASPGFSTRVIALAGGEAYSLDGTSHECRTWTVVEGAASVAFDDETAQVEAGDALRVDGGRRCTLRPLDGAAVRIVEVLVPNPARG
jgi:mannose-1-phosphate guanylyltransferase/mannose-6-phosphate isomerase